MTERISAFDFAVQFCTCKRKFKGTVPRVFQFQVFSWISFHQAPEYPIRAVLNFSKNWRNIHSLRVHHWCRWHWWQIYRRCSCWYRDNMPPVLLTTVANLHRWVCKCFFKSANLKSANSWAQFAIENQQISQICESKNFILANFFLLNCKSQISKFLRQTAANCKSKNFPP